MVDHHIEQNMFLFIKKQPLGDPKNSRSNSLLDELNFACQKGPFLLKLQGIGFQVY